MSVLCRRLKADSPKTPKSFNYFQFSQNSNWNPSEITRLFVQSGFQSNASNLYRSIRLKNHWFCSLNQNLDGPNFPKIILSIVHLVIQAQFPRNCSWVNLSNFRSKAFNLWQNIWLGNCRIRSLHRNPTGRNTQKCAIGQTLSPYWNPHSSVTTDLISYFIVSI